MTPEQIAEYSQLRQEISARLVMHHNQLALATVLQLVCALFVMWLNHPTANWESTELFLLIVPIVFAGLTFNYQANQCTMESVGRYLNQQYGNSGMKWEEFFGTEKFKSKLVSFSKALPLIWPLFIPVVLWSVVGWPEGKLASSLFVVDLTLLIIMLANFRYKLR
jgi:hypothetical protein